MTTLPSTDVPLRRVLILTPDYPPAHGGIQTLMGKLAELLPVPAVCVVTLDAPGARAFDRPRRAQVRRVRVSRHRLRIAALSARAAIETARYRPDALVLGHVAVAPAGLLLRRALGIPAVLYVHAEEFRVWPALCALAVPRVDAVIAVSRHARRMATAAGAPPPRVHVIHHGVDLPPALPGARESEPPTVLTVARMTDAHKGHDVMLRAWPLVLERVPRARWVIVGDGPLRAAYEKQAAARGLSGSIVFTGGLDDAARDRWLARAHVFAMPTRVPDGGVGGEGFGIVYLEAAAHGLPVVAAAQGGALDAVDDGRTGLLVDPTDPVAVAEAIGAILGDPERGREMGLRAREWAARFPWPVTADRAAEVLAAVAAGGRSA